MLYLVLTSLLLLLTDKPAYKIFDKNGKEVPYKSLLKVSSESDIILFGEIHNNSLVHWIELELAKDLYKDKKSDLIIGTEVMETDEQLVINEYLSGLITYKTLENEINLWPNFSTDYKPILEFSKENQIQFIATNVPRRYASLVAYKGLNSLNTVTEDGKRFLPPLPIDTNFQLPGYKAMQQMQHASHSHNMPFLQESQALKDATMAYNILKYWSQGKTLMHINGSYHSNNFEGIYWYVTRKNPREKVITISSVEQNQLENLDPENKGIADFIIVTPETITKTH